MLATKYKELKAPAVEFHQTLPNLGLILVNELSSVPIDIISIHWTHPKLDELLEIKYGFVKSTAG